MSDEVEDALVARANSYAGVTAIIGSGSACRFYPVKLPQAPTYPACSYNVVSSPVVSAMGADTGIARPRFSVGCWAETFKGARDLATQVRKCFQRYNVVWAGPTNSVEILDVWKLTHMDLYDDAAKVHYRVVDFQVDHRDV